MHLKQRINNVLEGGAARGVGLFSVNKPAYELFSRFLLTTYIDQFVC